MITHTPPSDDPPIATDARGWGLLLVLCGASFLESLDISMVTVALPSIDSELDLSTSTLQWLLGGYALGYGGFLLLGGRTADLLGRRRVFLVSLTVFAGASLLGALASGGALLIAARFVTGVSAAFAAPAGLSIITTTFPEGPARNRALAIYTATAASGFSFGLVFGGLLTSIDWRLTFALPALVTVAIVLAGRRLLARDEPADRTQGRYDLAGAATITAAMLALVYAVTQAPEAGWSDPSTIALLAAAAALAAGFVTIERRVAHPLVRLAVLRSPTLVRANVVMATIGGFVAFQFVATLYLQDVLDWTVLETALAFLPGGVLIALAAPRIVPVVTRLGPTLTLSAGMLAFALGYLLYLRIDADIAYAAVMLPTMLLLGVGFSLAYPAANMMATNGVADAEQGLASGLVNTSFQLGGALTLAIVAAVVSSRTDGASDPNELLDAFRPALVVIAAGAMLGLASALTGARGSRRAGPASR